MKYIKQSLRHLIIPVIGMLAVAILAFVFINVANEQERILSHYSEKELSKSQDLRAIYTTFSLNHAQVIDLLTATFQHIDEAQIYDNGVVLLDRIDSDLEQLNKFSSSHMLNDTEIELYQSLLNLFVLYHKSTRLALEIASVELSNVPDAIRTSNETFLQATVLFTTLIERFHEQGQQSFNELKLQTKGRLNTFFISVLAVFALFIVGAYSSISMLKRIENVQQSLDYVQRKADNIIRSMADALIVTDDTGRIRMVNSAAERMLNYSYLNFTRKKLQDIVKSDKDLQKTAEQNSSTTQEKPNPIEVTFVTADGNNIPTIVSGAVIGGTQKNVTKEYVYVVKDISERHKTEQLLNYLATHDQLTRLPNRSLLMDRLNQILARQPWNNRQSAVIFLDLDKFKDVNDKLGHQAGDELLIQIAERLSSSVREGDTVARIGGDEFVILLNDMDKDTNVNHIADKILQSLQKPIELNGVSIVATSSLGISVYPVDGTDAQTLLKHADDAMYEAKRLGRNNYQFYRKHG